MYLAMGKRSIFLGGKEFKNKGVAKKYVRALMERYKHGEHIIGEDFRLVADLLKRFSDADVIIGVGIKDIILQVGIGTDRFFKIIRVDGSWTTRGYHNGLSPKKNITKFKEACRNTVSRETCGDLAFGGEGPAGYQVHHVTMFNDIIKDFIWISNIDVDTVKIVKNRYRLYVFQDDKLTEKILEYTRQVCILRLLLTEDHNIETSKQWESKRKKA